MNFSIATADKTTHLRIVVIALIASIMIASVAIMLGNGSHLF